MVMRKDRFYLYDKGTIATVYGGMLFLNGILVALCVFFTVRFIGDHDPGWIVLDVFLILAIVFTFILSLKGNAWRKYCISCLVNESGIHCRGLLWRPFTIQWEDVRTCGIYTYNISYIKKTVIVLSKEHDMKDSKNIEEVNFVSRERIAIECRQDVWEILSKFIPNDIRKKFEDANTHSRNAFFRR